MLSSLDWSVGSGPRSERGVSQRVAPAVRVEELGFRIAEGEGVL